jgi:hypothetical protein
MEKDEIFNLNGVIKSLLFKDRYVNIPSSAAIRVRMVSKPTCHLNGNPLNDS